MDRFDNPHIVRIGSLASLRLTRPALSFGQILFKRLFDIVAASAILIASLPVLLLIALAIKLDSNGPVLFLQRRYGFNQEPFRIFKFRTMTTTDAATTMMTSTAKTIDRVPWTSELKMILSMSAGDAAPVSSSPLSRASTKASRCAK